MKNTRRVHGQSGILHRPSESARLIGNLEVLPSRACYPCLQCVDAVPDVAYPSPTPKNG